MWVLSKMRLWKCEFCEKWYFSKWEFWDKLRIFAPVWRLRIFRATHMKGPAYIIKGLLPLRFNWMESGTKIAFSFPFSVSLCVSRSCDPKTCWCIVIFWHFEKVPVNCQKNVKMFIFSLFFVHWLNISRRGENFLNRTFCTKS